MNRIIQNRAGSAVDPAHGSGSLTGLTSEDCSPSSPRITSSAWEGWWWGDPVEESVADRSYPDLTATGNLLE